MFKRLTKPMGRLWFQNQYLLQAGAPSVYAGAARKYSDANEPPDTNPPPLCTGGKDSSGCGGKIKDVVCGEKIEKKAKKADDGFQFHHLIAYPDWCCEDICAKDNPRFDDCFYKPSDKTRLFQQTWVECPKIQIKPKKLCCFDQGIYPKIERRKRVPPSERCEEKKDACIEEGLCKKIKLPGCKEVADVVSCKRERRKAYCNKVKTPYPAYSECQSTRKKPPRATECNCLALPPMCLVYQVLQKYEKMGKSPFKCP